jgi:outer membrane protein OmpA-like peptidoglycan-associated protein
MGVRGVATRYRWLMAGLALAAPLALAGCSSLPDAVNPVAWYRDLSGASKNDALDKSQNNRKNLEAGSKEPYPNLADVPDAPDQALSTIDRDKLQESLAADRENAKYTADRLRAGATPANTVPPPPSPTPVRATANQANAAPQQTEAGPHESSLVSPSVGSVPAGDAPPAPPPMPKLPPTPVARTDVPPPPTRTAALGSGQRRGAPTSSRAVAVIDFSDGSSALSEDDRNRLSEIAAMQHQQGGAIRIIGHAKPGSDPDATQQLDSFTLALGRAKAVAQELGAEGVPSSAIEIETAPSHADDAAASRAEIFLEH